MMAVCFFLSKFMASFPNLFEKLLQVREVYNCKKKKKKQAKKKEEKKNMPWLCRTEVWMLTHSARPCLWNVR